MKIVFSILFVLSFSYCYAQRDNGVHKYSNSENSPKVKKSKKNKKSSTHSYTDPVNTNYSRDTSYSISDSTNTNYQTDSIDTNYQTDSINNNYNNSVYNNPNSGNARDSTKKKVRGYTALTFTLGMHPALKQHGGIASLDYTYKQLDYNISQQVHFSRQFTDKKFLMEIGLLGWEKNLNYRYTEIKTGILMGKHGGALYLAYGMGFRKEISEGRAAVRLGVSFFYTGRVTNLGNIDNSQKDILIDGYVFHKTFSTSSKYGSYTYDASYIKNKLTYNCFGIKPKISIEFFPESKNTSFRFNVGYNIALSDNTKLNVEQYAKKGSGGGAGKYHNFNLSDPNLHYSFAGSKGNTPYGINGLFINVELSCKVMTLYKKR